MFYTFCLFSLSDEIKILYWNSYLGFYLFFAETAMDYRINENHKKNEFLELMSV